MLLQGFHHKSGPGGGWKWAVKWPLGKLLGTFFPRTRSLAVFTPGPTPSAIFGWHTPQTLCHALVRSLCLCHALCCILCHA